MRWTSRHLPGPLGSKGAEIDQAHPGPTGHAAGSLQAATTVFNPRPDCKDHTTNEDKIRKLLHLPLVT